MKFEVIRVLTVRREFRAEAASGRVAVHRDCGIGCTCDAVAYKATPSAELAESKTFCFSDRSLQGISEKAGTARLVSDAGGVMTFELQADLVEGRKS